MSLSDVLASPCRAMHSTVASSTRSSPSGGGVGSPSARSGSGMISATCGVCTDAKTTRLPCIGARRAPEAGSGEIEAHQHAGEAVEHRLGGGDLLEAGPFEELAGADVG